MACAAPVEDERVLVASGIHSRSRAADELGVEDPEQEYRRWLEEQREVEGRLSVLASHSARSEQGDVMAILRA